MLYKKLIAVILGSSTLLSIALGDSTQTVLAQTVSPQVQTPTTPTTQSQQALQELTQVRSANTLGDSNLNLLQLIHNAGLLSGRSSAAVQEAQSESINDAIQEFRAQQSQKLEPKTKSAIFEAKPVK